MTSFVVRDATHLGADRIATSTTAFALYENLKAVLEKDSTAVAAGWVLANGYITAAMMGSSAISQSTLITTTGDVGVGPLATVHVTLPGGQYGFYPQVANNSVGDTITANIANNKSGTSLVTNITLQNQGGNSSSLARQRYIQSSPPYNLGDGPIPLFVFALVDSSGKVLSTYVAEDPPWANNGPTRIAPDFIGEDGKQYQMRSYVPDITKLMDPAKREEELSKVGQETVVEVTQDIKQADMTLIPHPFLGNDLTGKTVVLLDPVASLTEQLRSLNSAGESVSNLLLSKNILLDNSRVNRAAPSGVMPVSAAWKQS